MKIRTMLAAVALSAVAATAMTTAAQAQSQRLDWRIKDLNAQIGTAIGFTAPRNGSQSATVIMQLSNDELVEGTNIPFRGMELNFVVECGAQRWKMIDGAYRDANNVVVQSSEGTDWAPLDRSGAIQIMVSDVCTGAHSGAPGLRNADVVAAHRWVAGQIAAQQ